MKVIVIGAGAAGLMAAGQAAANGADVTVLEKNDRPGRKLLITGKGRCNITNTVDIKEFIKNIPGNGQFLYSAFNGFGNRDLILFFNENGVLTKEERGGRVFPVSDRAQDVVESLVNFCISKGVEFRYSASAAAILAENQRVSSVKLKDGSLLRCDSAILATGGASYPNTGSTGDGYRIAETLGHTIIPLKPSLVPLETEEEWVQEVQGLALKNVEAAVLYNGQKAAAEFGEMLFTHFGVSGPVILSLSRTAAGLLEKGYKVQIRINLKPALSSEQLDSRIQRDFNGLSRKQYKNSLGELLPKSLIPVIIKLSGIPEEKPVNQITREERFGLTGLLQSLTLKVSGLRPLAEAIVTAGGISVKQINPKTMESKLIKGLFLAGEVVDVDGYTGGYNLQAAFSMGYLAGINAVR
ncbi:NAD(P)/FAD-dependent oxidoreductase [Phosphitispora sp. TUW77]|uniref:NAD(P)/FAD-dependent oxidoreductase n=1 Tax=Phosphitispora sp. TUW77 TaxID=3152361 RepID=UPI003AB5DD52